MNGIKVQYLNEIPYKVIQEYINIHKQKSTSEILEFWRPFSKYTYRNWIVCDKEEHDGNYIKLPDYSYEIVCPDGESIWVNKDGWMHHPKKKEIRDTIQEFMDAVNEANLGISIIEEKL